MSEVTKESIIAAAKTAAEQTGGVLSKTEFHRISGISDYHIYRHFPDGGWTEVQNSRASSDIRNTTTR